MRKFWMVLVVALVWLGLGVSTASAQEEGDVKEISFEDDLIEGELMAPSGERFNTLGEGELSSLIRVREDFKDEMIKSVEDL